VSTAILENLDLVPDRRCGYVAGHRAPRCERLAAVHALVDVDGADVGMASCAEHQPALHRFGWIRGMHHFGPGCAHPVSTWGSDGCMPSM
jgi:hypothetical protein